MRKILLAASAACLLASSAWAMPSPDSGLSGLQQARTVDVDRKDEIKLAFCGYFLAPGVAPSIRYSRGSDGRFHVVQLRDWPVSDSTYRCF